MTPAQAIVKLAELGLPTDKLAAALSVLEAMEEGLKAPVAERRQKDRDRKRAERASEPVQGIPRTNQDSDGQIANKERVSHTLPKETTTNSKPITPASRPNPTAIPFPDDFWPDDTGMALASKLDFDRDQITEQLERIRDWAKNADSGKSRKKDWNAFFRNWLKKAADDRKDKQQRNQPRQSAADKLNKAFDNQFRFITGHAPPARTSGD